MFVDDRDYFQHRAEVEAERARQATTPVAAERHRELASAYRDRLSRQGALA